MEITGEIVGKAREMIGNHLDNYQDQISAAFIENDEILDVNLKVRFSMNKGKFKIQSDINFTAEKIKDKQTIWYDPNQREMFTDEEPAADPGIEG
jgi:hypothetical protein